MRDKIIHTKREKEETIKNQIFTEEDLENGKRLEKKQLLN